ncbi:MAG: type II toxin-antitoxin system RelE/ParE family toxin [Myxococcota bacterium]
MPNVRFSARALKGLDRIFDFIAEHHPDLALRSAEVIIDATAVLQRHPLIGRPVEGSLRELVISHGPIGYIALYRFISAEDRVEILAIRHQREAGFK